MEIRNIITEGNELLRKKSEKITKFDDSLKELIEDMKSTLKNSGGVGIAAPQIGVLKRAVVIDFGEDIGKYAGKDIKPLVLINPRIVEKSGSQECLEGCLSCPGQFGIIKRPMKVTVKAQDIFGNEHTYNDEGFPPLASAFCHEIDHLDGILFKDNVIRMLTQEELDSMTRLANQ